MTEPEHDPDLDGLAADYQVLPTDPLLRAVRFWRDAALQWQAWADSTIKELGLNDPNVMHGRRDSQAMISIVITRLMRYQALPTIAEMERFVVWWLAVEDAKQRA